MKILHLPTDVGGNGYYLSLGEKKIGLDSTVLVYKSSKYNFPNDIDLHLEKYHWSIQEIKKLKAFLTYGKKYDIFVFNFGTSFINPRFLGFLYGIDLPFLRTLGKKIVVFYQGCDARQKDFSTANFEISSCGEPSHYGEPCSNCNSKTDAFKRKQIRWFSRFAHKVFTVNPDLMYVLPKAEFIPYAGNDFTKIVPNFPDTKSKKVTILHAPTSRRIKGSYYILPILEKLSKKFPFVEVLLAESVPQQVMWSYYYQKADIYIDQVLMGWYGRAAVHAMTMGTPTVCYIREKDLSFLPSSLVKDLPIINATKYNLYDVLVELIHNKEKLREIGKKSRAYVEKYHDPVKIAKKMKKAYESLL